MQKIEYKKMFDLENTYFWFIGKRFFVDSILLKYKTRIHKVLDLGSGTGGLTKYLEAYGEVFGIEQNGYSLQLAKKRNINIKKGNINNLRVLARDFDLTTIF